MLADTIGMSVPNAPVTNSRIGQGMSESSGSKLSVNEPAGHYTFTYQTTLPWLIWNEFNDANVDPDPTKWPPPAVLRRSRVLMSSRPRGWSLFCTLRTVCVCRA